MLREFAGAVGRIAFDDHELELQPGDLFRQHGLDQRLECRGFVEGGDHHGECALFRDHGFAREDHHAARDHAAIFHLHPVGQQAGDQIDQRREDRNGEPREVPRDVVEREDLPARPHERLAEAGAEERGLEGLRIEVGEMLGFELHPVLPEQPGRPRARVKAWR